ncbi:hypothetical protein L211DRAFT_853463 [Terfezia boudieri ATCC MYA-4762]|uniref:Uncharacterized protein n=1 Tax=Terfezia boudieri ATCC MYA-4762 TaxID=1051890 RepID=A0A3N4L8G9_9PEZI|nr:hypothetical protein L211DRAFT_853463 [Terfezia boudieri ATCC MYA-4762]
MDDNLNAEESNNPLVACITEENANIHIVDLTSIIDDSSDDEVASIDNIVVENNDDLSEAIEGGANNLSLENYSYHSLAISRVIPTPIMEINIRKESSLPLWRLTPWAPWRQTATCQCHRRDRCHPDAPLPAHGYPDDFPPVHGRPDDFPPAHGRPDDVPSANGVWKTSLQQWRPEDHPQPMASR